MALHLYAGLLKVVPLQLDSGDQLKAFNIRLDNLYAIDLQFLHGFEQPTLAYLAEVNFSNNSQKKQIAIFTKYCAYSCLIMVMVVHNHSFAMESITLPITIILYNITGSIVHGPK